MPRMRRPLPNGVPMKLAPWVHAERAKKYPRHRFEEAHDDPAPARLCWTCLWTRKNRIHTDAKHAPKARAGRARRSTK